MEGMKSRRYRAVLLTTILLFSYGYIAFTPSRAADYTRVGAKTGDTANYSVKVTGPPPFGNTTEDDVRFIEVKGTLVSLQDTLYYSNGTHQVENITGDISTGSNYTWYYLVAANLSAHDPICSGSVYEINKTATKTVMGMSRLVNHLAFNDSSPGEYWNVDYYWDKETGLIVQILQDSNATGIHWTSNLTLTSTTIFSPPSNPTAPMLIYALGILGIAAVILVGVILIRRRGRTGKTASATRLS